MAYVDVQRAKVLPELLLLFDADVLEILVAEDNDTALGDEQGQFVLLDVAQLGELEPADLGANTWSQFGH